MELEVLNLSRASKRYRPFASFATLMSKLKSVHKLNLEILNDRLVKIDDKYYSVNRVSLTFPLVQLIECQVIGPVILAHILTDQVPLAYSTVNINQENIQVTFAFDTNGDFVDKKTISKLGILGLTSKYKIFTY